MRYVILGTAGHIDHGKSALVNALTGRDPDRLKEEKERGIEPRLFGSLLGSLKDIVVEKEIVRLATFNVTLSRGDETLKTKILGLLEKAGAQPPNKEELCQIFEVDQKHLSDILKLMVKEGSLVRINDSLYITSSVYRQVIENLKNFFSKKSEMTVRESKDILPTSRRHAIPLLEFLDAHKVTRRVGQVRKLLLTVK